MTQSHPHRPHTPLCRRSTMVDRLELLNRQVAGNCAAVVADDDAAVVAALARELPKAQVRVAGGGVGCGCMC